MIEIAIVGEGQTEETFLREIVAPELAQRDIFAVPRLIRTSRKGRGGALTKDRVLHYLPRMLRERDDLYVSTFFDLYGLARDFPGLEEATSMADPVQRTEMIEAGFRDAVVESARCQPDRFLPHIQPYEFESLLFSDVSMFAKARPEWSASVPYLSAARASVASPEHINDGPTTHPSARLREQLSSPRYDKRLDGSIIAARIGLPRIRAQCAHFANWLDRIEGLPQLPTSGSTP